MIYLVSKRKQAEKFSLHSHIFTRVFRYSGFNDAVTAQNKRFKKRGESVCSYMKLLPTRFCRSSRVIRLLFLKTRRFLQICLSAFLQTNICNSHKSNQEGKKDVFSDFVNCPINAPTLCSRSILIMKQVKIINNIRVGG